MKSLIGAAVFTATAVASAHAATIVAPASVTVNSGGVANPQYFAVDNIIDQSGLSKSYVPGVTDFDAFVASDPTHMSDLATRWLSKADTSAATLTFDFGRDVTLSKLALWDDRSTSISRIRMSTPGLGAFRDLNVTDVLQTVSHGEVFAFRPVTTRYLTFEISGCNNSSQQNWSGCGLNEVVFAGAPATGAVPEPATWAMMILGFGATGAALRRRRLALA